MANFSNQEHPYPLFPGLLAEVDDHPFDLDKMLLMDWRDSHLRNDPYLHAGNLKVPSFLYAMPFDKNLVFLEQTNLVSQPLLSYMDVKNRMVARLNHQGIRVRSVIEDEKCLIPMGGPLPRIPQSLSAIGGNAGLVHPATGYCLTLTMARAPFLAAAIAECHGSTGKIRGRELYRRAWDGLWPLERRFGREFNCVGMEILLKMDLNETRRLFDAFFDINPHYKQCFLSSTLSLGEHFILGISLFGHASYASKLDLLTKLPAPLVKLMRNVAMGAI